MCRGRRRWESKEVAKGSRDADLQMSGKNSWSGLLLGRMDGLEGSSRVTRTGTGRRANKRDATQVPTNVRGGDKVGMVGELGR